MGISVVYSTETGYTIFVQKGITVFTSYCAPLSHTLFPLHPTNFVE